ncbi:hypothetical protein K504DRAFT_458884 [Pleomassaria siparia CBS 279.74]|uniref:Carboxymuconolactone decarboxylase-like domain-containing protein n=1 Tax=Pleomassaria siparia CBS 279.74 TaxID=1314801 RepID=A0A6G1K4Q8_9PLEO|nr:hypothetical protein K504DRAFT_458884 [Pleomassaria siparia CBS 279.74]
MHRSRGTRPTFRDRSRTWLPKWAGVGYGRHQAWTESRGALINLGIYALCALNRSTELGVLHVRGALRNGLSEVEIREALLQVGGYCGFAGW